jgi:hypothetical protein
MIELMLRAALLVCALSGCDIVFRVDHISPTDATSRDTAPPDAFALCAQSFLDDSFDNGVPCDTWGMVNTAAGGSVTESNGSLVVQPAANMVGSRGGCYPNGLFPFGPEGAIAEVSHAMGGSDAEFTLLSSGSLHLAVAVANNQIVFQNDVGTVQFGTAVVYVASSMRFWRIRPMGTGAVVGEYSANGRDWNELGQVTMAVPATASFGFLAGLNNNRPAQAAPDKAVYERFVVCP